MLGPYIDTDAHSGVIFAKTESREAFQKIFEEDCYYPDFAKYEIREFAPKMIAADIALEMVKHYDDTLMLKGSKNSKQSCWWGLGCRVDSTNNALSFLSVGNLLPLIIV